MKRHQTFPCILLIYFVSFIQVLAVDLSSKAASDETGEMIQSISIAVRTLASFSNQQQGQIDLEIQKVQTLQTNLDSLSSELERVKNEKKRLTEAITKKEADIEGKIKAAGSQAEKLKEIANRIVVIAEKMEEILQIMSEILGQDRNAQNVQLTLTAISQDNTKVAKLIEAIKDKNQTSLRELLKPKSGSVNVEVQEVKNINGLSVVFRLGGLTNCLSTKNQCGGKSFSISK